MKGGDAEQQDCDSWISADKMENCGGEQTSLEERSRQFCSVNEHKKILF